MHIAPTTSVLDADVGCHHLIASTSNSCTAAAASTTAGLQKWTYTTSSGSWQLACTLQNGLKPGTPSSPPAGPPEGAAARCVSVHRCCSGDPPGRPAKACPGPQQALI
jgi:hypothetical protein